LNKINEVETLRGLGFLAVVMQHTIAEVFYQADVEPLSIIKVTTFLGLIRFAVPLFIFITGLVMFYNYQDMLNYSQFLLKRLTKIFLPYFISTVFYYFWYGVLFGIPASSTLTEIIKITKLTLTGQGSYHLWYIILIMQFYILFPLFRLLISSKRKMQTNVLILIITFFINIVIVYAFNNGKISTNYQPFNQITTYLDRNFILWIFYFVLGGFVGIYYEQWKKFVHKTKLLNMIFLLVCMCFIYLKISKKINLTGNKYILCGSVTSPLTPFMMIVILVLLFLIFSFALELEIKKSKLSSILMIFGKYSFGEYLIHAFVLRFANTFVVEYFNGLNLYLQTILIFMLCSIFSLFLCFLISKIKTPLGEAIVGKV